MSSPMGSFNHRLRIFRERLERDCVCIDHAYTHTKKCHLPLHRTVFWNLVYRAGLELTEIGLPSAGTKVLPHYHPASIAS